MNSGRPSVCSHLVPFPPMSEEPLASENPVGFPSPGMRTLLTLFLFFHFFAILAGIAGNFGARSGLRRQLRASPGVQPYLHTLGIDTGYGYGLISNTADDLDHLCEIVVNPPIQFEGAADEMENVQKINLIPDAARAWGMQKRRYLTLASWLAALQGDNNEEANLVSAIAGGMLQRAEVESGTHRFFCRVQQTQDMISLDEIEPELQNPNHPRWFDTVYDADLIFEDDHWSPSKRGGRGEMTQSRSKSNRRRNR